MTDKEKLDMIRKLADAMYYAAQYLTTDASRLRKAMDEYHQFIITEYNKQEPTTEDLKEEITRYFSKNPIRHLTDWPALKNTALHFAQWQKEQMMKDAVSGCIEETRNFDGSVRKFYATSDFLPVDKYQNGQEVKLIIVKDNE